MSEVKPLSIAIIGGGFSGTMVAVHLLKTVQFPLNIALIESHPRLGMGVAYSTKVADHLLNVPAGNMSAFPDDPDHFWRWLRETYGELEKTAFVPRRWYGEYIRYCLKKAQEESHPHVSFRYLPYKAIDMRKTVAGLEVRLNDGSWLEVDQVVLALGNFPPSHPPIEDRSFYQDYRYWTAWDALPLLTTIPPETPILLLGSGLTALDLAVLLYQHSHRGKVYAVSRRGFAPHPHQPYDNYHLSFDRLEGLSPRQLLRLIRSTLKTENNYDWRAIIDSFRPYSQLLWKSFTNKEKRQFLRHLRPYWDNHRHRIAPETAQILAKMRSQEQFILYGGQVTQYKTSSTTVQATIQLRQQAELLKLDVGLVINCTGPESNYRQLRHPLIVNLLEKGMIRPDPLNLGLDVHENGALFSREGQPSSHLYTLGPPQKGSLWETTAVPEIRQQAQTLAKILVDRSLKF